jgi:NhaA family Na+:H+ antiporter
LIAPARPYFDRNQFYETARQLGERFRELRRRIETLASQKHLNDDQHARLERLNEREETALGELHELIVGTEAPVDQLRRLIFPWVNYLVLPLFAFANSGVGVGGAALQSALASPVAWGVFAALLIGKPLGIVAAGYLAAKLGVASLPDHVTWRHVTGMGILGGVGFTVSLFIAALAFTEEQTINDAKMGIFAASLLAGLAGYLFLRFTAPGQRAE